MPNYQALTASDIGLPSFDTITNVPLSQTARTRVEKALTDLDTQKQALSYGQVTPEQFQSSVQGFRDTWDEILRGGIYVTPPPSQVVTSSTMPATTAASSQTTAQSATSRTTQNIPGLTLNIDEETSKLLSGDDAGTQDIQNWQREWLRREMSRPDWGANEQAMLDTTKQSLEREAARRTDAAQTRLAGQGLGRGGEAVRAYQSETDWLTDQVGQAETNFRIAAAQAGVARKQGAFDRATALVSAIKSNNAAMASALVQLYQVDSEAGLSREQLDLQRYTLDQNIALERDKLSSEDKQRLMDNGFREREIQLTEQQLQLEYDLKNRQLAAEVGLNNSQLQLQRDIFNENSRLARDQFTETQRAALKAEGFTETQIKNAEEQQKWERVYYESQSRADNELANKNLDLQAKALELQTQAQNRQLTLAEKQEAFQEIKDSQQMSLDQAMFEFKKAYDTAGQQITRDQVDAQIADAERRFGLDLNEFEFEKYLKTGELDLKVLDSQRRYDLDKESMRRQWMLSKESLELQRTLGMSEIEMKAALGQGELDINREQQILERYMFEQGLAWDKEKFRVQLEEARKAKKGSFLGSLVKGIVGAGVGFLTGGVGGAIIGAASSFFGPDQTRTMIANVEGAADLVGGHTTSSFQRASEQATPLGDYELSSTVFG